MAGEEGKAAINTYTDGTIKPGMLSSPHIQYCVHKYEMIKDYHESCFGPATYHMRLGGNVLTWDKGEKIEFTLKKHPDWKNDIRSNLELKPNSLTFITTIEEFNLPQDIIARFNLKSKWVHEGLLLGTGPIVDPELKGHLLIPLHNFSSQSVYMNYGDPIISVEFTKTLNPGDHFLLHGKTFGYVPNESSRFFNFDGYRKRIGQKTVESSVSSTFAKYTKIMDEYKNKVRVISWIAAVTVLATWIGLITLVLTSWNVVESAKNEVINAANNTAAYRERLDGKIFSEQVELRKRMEKLEETFKSKTLTDQEKLKIRRRR